MQLIINKQNTGWHEIRELNIKHVASVINLLFQNDKLINKIIKKKLLFQNFKKILISKINYTGISNSSLIYTKVPIFVWNAIFILFSIVLFHIYIK